ncbi:MAG: ABC transporter ATP-binding protein [Christensenellaceae bacterium]
MLELKNICKTYEDRGVKTEVLKGVSLTIETGEFVCLLGRSGSGKSTLLNLIGMMDVATNGHYYFNGKDVTILSENARAEMRSRDIGYIFQSFHLVAELNVLDNVTLPMGYTGVSSKERHRRGLKLLELVGLSHRAKYWPAQLSGGEKQRVAIARALSNHPSLILADEPTGNLDYQNGLEIMNLLKKLNAEDTTIVMVTHDTEFSKFADRVLIMKDGMFLPND